MRVAGSGPSESMRRFWDRRAREDAAFFVDDRLAYGGADSDSLWMQGEEALRAFRDLLGIEVGPRDTVLEIGCGLGRMTRAIAARAAAVVALDVSPEMLARARRLHPGLANVTWLAGDGVSLAGVDDGSIDACISHVVFQHIPDPAITFGYVGEIARVLAPGGWAALGVSNDPAVHRPRPASTLARWRRRMLETTRRAPRGQGSPYWLGSAIDLEEFDRVTTSSGMVVERVWGAGTQFCLVLLRSPAA